MLVEWGTVVAILVPVAGLVGGAFRVLDRRLTRIDHQGEERYRDLVALIRSYYRSVPAHSDSGVGP